MFKNIKYKKLLFFSVLFFYRCSWRST